MKTNQYFESLQHNHHFCAVYDKARINCNLGIPARRMAPGPTDIHHYLYSYSYFQALPFFTGVSALIYFYLKYFKMHILYSLVFITNICKENISLEIYIRTLSCLSSAPRRLKPGNSNTTGRASWSNLVRSGKASRSRKVQYQQLTLTRIKHQQRKIKFKNSVSCFVYSLWKLGVF